MTRINGWIDLVTGCASDREISRLTGIGQSTLSRQRRETAVTVETSVKIARTYQTSVIPALIALNIINDDDLKLFSGQISLEHATDEALVTEILRRLKGELSPMSAPASHVSTVPGICQPNKQS